MKRLIIHNNNTFLSNPIFFKLEEQFVFEFDKDNSEIDKVIHNEITNGELKNKILNSEVLFIKISLSKNYLEYLGLRLAYHIRLTAELKDKSKIPIVFVAEESIQFIGITSSMPSLLYTRGVYFMEDNEEAFKKILSLIELKSLKSSEDINVLKETLNLPSPSNYSSHHSIENELALLTWSKYIGCYKNLPFTKFEFHNSLFYKLHKTEIDIQEIQEDLIPNENSGKILLIDDEANKGWDVFYENLFKKVVNIEFFESKISFDNKTKKQIIIDLKTRIQEVNPDLVLLDIRLCDEDFEADLEPKELSGYLIAEAIKEFNKGIQIIITSASNKIWNFSAFEKFGSIDYLLKSYTSDIGSQFSEFALTITRKLECSQLLKPVFSKINFTLKQLSEQCGQHQFGEEFYDKTRNHLETSFALLEKSVYDPLYRNHAYLQLYFILEDFANSESIFVEGEECSVLLDSQTQIVVLIKHEILENNSIIYECPIAYKNGRYNFRRVKTSPIRGKLQMDLKMHLILFFRYGQNSKAIQDWKKLNKVRNDKAGHSGIEKIVTRDDLFLIFDFIHFIFENKNVDGIHRNKSLKVSIEEKKDALMEKFNGSKKRK